MVARKLITAGLVGALLLGAMTACSAAVISEDVSYWYRADDGSLLTEFNPAAEWLSTNLPRLLIKVQQTVYDVASCNAILERAGQKDKEYIGYLYSYTVTNLDWGDLADPTERGLTKFTVNWGSVAPQKVTVSAQTPAKWIVDTSVTDPAWVWNDPVLAGLLTGESVGGLLAVGPVAPDGVVTAVADRSGPDSIALQLVGQTTGPVTDPASIVTLMSGIVGLAATRLRRRKA
mgnify:CR=1 FL=1